MGLATVNVTLYSRPVSKRRIIMGSKPNRDKTGNSISRREVLGRGAVLLGLATVLSLPFKLFHGSTSGRNLATDLPGDDSIFQPRKDQNLRKYLQDKSF